MKLPMSAVRKPIARLHRRLTQSQAADWFSAQSQRDRALLLATGGFLLLVLGWLLLWQPVQDRLRQAEQRHARARDDHLWLQGNQNRLAAIAQQQAMSTAGPGQALLGIVSNSARQHDIALSRFTPEGNDALSVSLENVPFSALVEWLAYLEAEEGIRARSVTMDAQQQGGLVRARLVLN